MAAGRTGQLSLGLVVLLALAALAAACSDDPESTQDAIAPDTDVADADTQPDGSVPDGDVADIEPEDLEDGQDAPGDMPDDTSGDAPVDTADGDTSDGVDTLTPGPGLAIGDVTVTEGDSGVTSATFEVTLSSEPEPGRDVSVSWATHDGSATAADDYVAASGTLTVSSGQGTSHVLTVDILGDLDVEPDEDFSVTLSSPVNATLERASGVATIVSQDLPRASVTDASVFEGATSDSNELVFTVALHQLPLAGSDAVLTWSLMPGSATPGEDYVDASGTLTFTAGGSQTQQVVVAVVGDDVTEPDETLTLALAVSSNAVLDGASATGTILADEVLSLSIDDAFLDEGDAGTSTMEFTVSLSPPPPVGVDVQVDWQTVEVTAETSGLSSARDFLSASGTLTFTSGGPTTQTLDVTINGDTRAEANELFFVELSDPVHARLSDPRGIGTIVNDDSAVVYVDTNASGSGDGTSWSDAFTSLQAGVDAADSAGGGEVWVANATYTATGTAPVLTMKPLVHVYGGFQGTETAFAQRDLQAGATVLDGQDTATHVVIGATGTLDGVTVTGGNAVDSHGGGFYFTGTVSERIDPVLTNCRFVANHADLNGGAFYVKWGETTMIANAFLANTADDDGGAIYGDVNRTSLYDSLFEGNVAGGEGGGVRNYNTTTQIRDCVFRDNQAALGGGVYLGPGGSGTPTIADSHFEGNVATSSGGGVYQVHGHIDDTTLTANTTSGRGGGVYVDDSLSVSTRLSGVTVTHNTANSGGGVAIRGYGVLVDAVIAHNTASTGGGVYTTSTFDPGVVEMQRVWLEGNHATTSGGGIYVSRTDVRVANAVVARNSAAELGGGVYLTRIADATLTSSSLEGNTAGGQGAALYVDELDATDSPAATVLVGNTLVRGQTPLDAIALSAVSPPVTIQASAITGCQASGASWNAACGADGGGNRGAAASYLQVPVMSFAVEPGSTPTQINLTDADLYVGVGDVIEVGRDGVARTVTAVSSTDISLTPAMSQAPAAGVGADHWGTATTTLTLDLRLSSASVALDAGDNALVPPDNLDLDADGDTAEALPTDIEGAPRFRDDPIAPDVGSGSAPIVDMGAYER